MRTYLPFIVIGVTTGAVYAIAAIGLVLTFRTSGVFNFAHGAIGMAATYCFYSLRVTAGLPTVVAAVLAIGGFAPLFGIGLDRLLLRRLHGAPSSVPIVTSLGLLVALQGAAIAIYGGASRHIESIFPTGTYDLGGVRVGYDQTIIVAVALLALAGLTLTFKRTRYGLFTRAVVADPTLTSMNGVSSASVTTLSWMVGCAFAALSGILIAPYIQLDSILLTLLVVQAFAAAIVGRLQSFTLAVAGAFGIGVAASLSTKLVASNPSFQGIPNSLPFLVLFAVLVFSRKGSFAGLEPPEGQGTGGTAGIRRTRVPWRTLAATVAVGAVLPAILNGSQLLTATTAVAFLLVFLALSLLVGLSRQVSLCQAVFLAFGATTMAHLLSAGVPYPAALLLAAILMVPVGAVVAIPAIRLSGLFLALATFGFGVLAQYLLFTTWLGFGKDSIVLIPRPHYLIGGNAFYYWVLGIVTIGAVVVEVVRAGRLGRVLQAMADSPTAVVSLGLSPLTARVLIFCLSAFLSALAGGLLGSLVQSVAPASFDFFQSLVWVIVLVLAGSASFTGALAATGLLVILPAVVTSPRLLQWQPVVFGLGAILLAQQPNGLVSTVRSLAGPAVELLRTRERSEDWGRHRRRLEQLAEVSAP